MRIRPTKLEMKVTSFLALAIMAIIFFLNFDVIFTKYSLDSMANDVKDTPIIKQLSIDITKSCSNVSCKFNAIASWVDENIEYRKDTPLENFFQLNNNIEYTLKYGGDCEAKIITLIDVLSQVGISSCIVLQPGHACALVKLDGRYVPSGCFEREFLGIKCI